MPCDTQLLPQQTISQRKSQIAEAIKQLDAALKRRLVRPVVGPQGAVTFTGWAGQAQSKITDACAYRRIMATGSALAKMEITRAEALAGRAVDRKVVATGVHSHDGGQSWHGKG